MVLLMSGSSVPYKDMPPDRITIACFTYMVRVMELRDFSSFIFGIVNSPELLLARMTNESKKQFRDAAAKYQIKADAMSIGRQLINEVLLTRSVESFDLYLLQLLRLLFSVRTDLVIEEEKLRDEVTKTKFKDADEYFLHLAERKLNQLAYKPLSELRAYFKISTGVELFERETDFEAVVLATQLRNLIAHNDCRINELFLKRVDLVRDKPALNLGERYAITDRLFRRLVGVLDHVVFTADERAAQTCNIPTMNRFTSFFFRGDFSPKTIR
jgi:hypothetical protein